MTSGLWGDVSVPVDSITMDSPTSAAVIYDVEVSGNVAASGQSGASVYQDGVWKVSDTVFCAVFGSAGQGLPGCTLSSLWERRHYSATQ